MHARWGERSGIANKKKIGVAALVPATAVGGRDKTRGAAASAVDDWTHLDEASAALLSSDLRDDFDFLLLLGRSMLDMTGTCDAETQCRVACCCVKKTHTLTIIN